MFFIAKGEKLYNLELLILFNWTNDRKNQLLHIKITSTGLKKTLTENYQIVQSINSLFI